MRQETDIANYYIQEMGEKAQQRLSFGIEDKKSLISMTTGQDGSTYFLYGEKDGNGEIQSYKLEKRDQELNEIYLVDTTAGMDEISALYDMETGTDGNLYGLTITGIVLCWDESTKAAFPCQWMD